MPNLEILCPNVACPDFSKHLDGQQQNREKFANTRKGVQWYRCQTCHKTFTETTRRVFFRKHRLEHEVLATLAESSRISSLSRVKEFLE